MLTVARFLKNAPCPTPYPPQDISPQCCLFRHLQTGTLLSKQSLRASFFQSIWWGAEVDKWPWSFSGGEHIARPPQRLCGLALQKDVSSGSKRQHGLQGQHRHFNCSLLEESRLTGETNPRLAAGLLIEQSGSHTLTLSWPKRGRALHVLLLPRVSAGSSALWTSLC